MNAPVAVHLGDSLPSAATGKTGLHKSANKEDLSAAKGQEFSKLLLAAQEKGNATVSASQEDVEPQGQDVKAGGAKDSKSVEQDVEVVTPSVSLPTLNTIIAQPVLASHASITKIAKDGVESAGDADKSKTAPPTEKASTDPAPTLQPVQAKETTEAMLLPASLPNMFPTLTRDSTAAPDVKGAQDKSDSGGSTAAKVVLGTSALDKVGGEYGAEVASPAVAQGQQLELAAKHADGSNGTTEATADVAGSNAVVVGADGRPTASATTKAASAVDASAAKASSDGASGVSSSTASAAASDAVRDAAAASSASDATQKAASAAVSASATAVGSSGTPAASHDAAPSALPAGTHDVPAAPTTQAAPIAQGAQTAMSDTGSPATKSDGLERAASTNSGLGSTDAHALLDGTTTGGRDGTWQISSNRVEAGFANDQNSWTSVIAQRQQGHVTAMVELGSSAEHSSTASMLPQLNAHLAERQLPVEQLGVSVRQQFTSGQDASAANQGQQSNQSSQSQRGQQTSAPVVSSVATTSAGIEGSRTSFDGNRISIRA